MNENVWSLLTTRDGMTAQLSTPRFDAYPTDELEVTPIERVATGPRRVTPLLRRLRTAAA